MPKHKPKEEKPTQAVYKTEVPLGLGLVLPTEKHEGVLIPMVHLDFDPIPGSVGKALAAPKTLTVDWPITGTERHLRSQSLTCTLSWKVKPDDEEDVRLMPASGQKTEIKIDGQGKFKVLVGGSTPKLDLVSTRLVQKGTVGFSIAIGDPPDVPVQESPTTVPYAVKCQVNVSIESDIPGPISEVRLGDKMWFSGETSDVLKGRKLMLTVVEQDAGDLLPGADEQAWSRAFKPDGIKPCAWTIGFSDQEGSFSQFSYADTYEEGDFEYGWTLSALDSAGRRVDILASKKPIVVKKPRLESFYVLPIDPERGRWRVEGKITGFSPAGPRARVGLKLVDRQGKRYPDSDAHMARPQLNGDGSFRQDITGPTSPPLIGPVRMPVYAILCLVPTLAHPEHNSIAGFLDYDEDTYALYDKTKGLCWYADTLWICSSDWSGVASRGAKPKSGRRGSIEPPGPTAGGDQGSPLTFKEIYLDICAWEGVVRHMYLDSKGYVTVGAGKCLPKVEDALRLDFRYKDGDRELKADEPLVRKIFNRVSKMPPGKFWADYATSPLLVLDNKVILGLAEDYAMTGAIPHLQGIFPKFRLFPKAARRAILDIAYNAGIYFFDKKTLRIRAAILAEDWTRAAAEVPTGGRKERLDWRRQLFTHAAAVKATTTSQS